MTTPVEAATDLYNQLKPEARGIAVEWVLARTPPDLQEEMIAVIEADIDDGIEPPDPPPTEAPTVVDAPYVGQTGANLNCTMGNWNGEPTSRTYQWNIGGGDVAGATAPDYTVQPADVGQPAYCVQTATNAIGTSAPVTSNVIMVA